MSVTRPIVAYALHDEDGRPIAERNADTVFYAASTIKLAVMLAVMLAVDAGSVELEESLECPKRFVSAVPGPDFAMAPQDTDPLYPADGGRLAVSALLGMMVSRSSNEATNVLIDRIGLTAVGDALRECGTSASKMDRKIGDLAATNIGVTNTISAHDAAMIMRCIVTGEFTTQQSTEFMRGLLTRQELVRIGSVIPAGTMWGSKSGDVPGIEHDVSFVGDPDGSTSVRYLAICTRGYEPDQGREVIAGVASALLSVDPRSRGGGA